MIIIFIIIALIVLDDNYIYHFYEKNNVFYKVLKWWSIWSFKSGFVLYEATLKFSLVPQLQLWNTY